ncbi:hypothetical protein BT69DRAFT_1224138 [Atractiella rhizophila]|nr:hypothetical protein BT69DRAFT_1224138 [Atractiella rhizophila]
MLAPLLLFIRIYALFDISFSSFKAIKSSRLRSSSKQPAVDRNGLTKFEKIRRRKLKEQVMAWLVWVVLLRAEGWADRTIAFFVPFYDEIKAMVMLFLIVFKISSSEMIFQNLFRPLVSPYEAILDPIIYHFQTIIHVIVLILSYPFAPLTRWYYRKVGRLAVSHPA